MNVVELWALLWMRLILHCFLWEPMSQEWHYNKKFAPTFSGSGSFAYSHLHTPIKNLRILYITRNSGSCCCWFSHKIKLFLGKINFSHVWANQNTFSKAKLLHAVTARLKDSYISFWRKCLFDDSANVTNGNKLRTYRTFKTSYCLENYLLSSNNSRKEISTFAKIRISCHKLHIEEGRYRKIPLQERICQLCSVKVEDEKHFVLSCSKLETCRKSFYDKITDIYPAFNFINISDQGRIQKFWKGGAQNSRVPNYRIPALTPFWIFCSCLPLKVCPPFKSTTLH